MRNENNKDPLHGITLKMMVTELQSQLGWEMLGQKIKIKCFTHDPSLSSSLKFLRRTPWAREKVEALYVSKKYLNEEYVSENAQPNPIWQQARVNRDKSGN